jgi:hypothetical protein
LDGNAHRHMATIAHATRIVDMCAAHDGTHVFTIGENSNTVHVWQINHDVLSTKVALAGTGMAPFFDSLDGMDSFLTNRYVFLRVCQVISLACGISVLLLEFAEHVLNLLHPQYFA